MATADFKITNIKKRNSDRQELVFEGDLSIFNSDQILKKLKRLKIDSPIVALKLKNISGFDLSTMQMILSLTKTVEINKNKVSIEADLPEDKAKLLVITALDKHLKISN